MTTGAAVNERSLTRDLALVDLLPVLGSRSLRHRRKGCAELRARLFGRAQTPPHNDLRSCHVTRPVNGLKAVSLRSA